MRWWIVVGTLALVACASPAPKTDVAWRRTSDSADPLDGARAACKAVAFERTKGITSQGIAAKAAAGAFAECMRERGWALVDQD